MPKLTLSMIVKNEEKNLQDCLNSVKDFVDEIVIIDTGSADDTLRIAEEFGANIFHFKWIDDFSAARNYSLLKSTGDWILYLDADERVSEESIEEINNIIKSPAKLGVQCIVNSINSKRNDSQKMKYIRLFKNSDTISFKGRAHEQIDFSLKQNSYEIIESSIQIIHLGYDVSETKLKEKASRNLNLLMKDYNLNRSSYLAYQIANSYSVLKLENEKIRYYKEALNDPNLNKELRSICYLNIAEHEMGRANLTLAEKYIEEGIKENNRHSLLNLIGTQIYGKLNDYEKAISLCEKALKINDEMAKNPNSFNNQNIVIDSKTILYQGLLLSLIAGNQISFNKFHKKLDQQEGRLIAKILKNNHLNKSELEIIADLVDKNNIEFYNNLLNSYNHANKLELLTKVGNKLELNPQFISYYSSFLISLGQIGDAQRVLENAIKFEVYTAPIFMYLSSVYIQTGQYEKILTLLKTIEPMTDKDPLLNQHFILIKDKLNSLLKKRVVLNQ